MPPTKDTAASDAAKAGGAGTPAPAAATGAGVTTPGPTPPTGEAAADAAEQGFTAVKKQGDEQSTSGHGAQPVPVDTDVIPAMDPKRDGAQKYTVKSKNFFYSRSDETGKVGKFQPGDPIYLTDEEAKQLRRSGHIE